MCISELPSLSKYTVNNHDIVLTKRLSKKRHRNKMGNIKMSPYKKQFKNTLEKKVFVKTHKHYFPFNQQKRHWLMAIFETCQP